MFLSYRFDIHSPMATITEALWFSGRLRLPEEIPDSRVHSFVQEVMQLVELTSLANAIILSLIHI